MSELHARITALEAELAALKAAVGPPSPGPAPEPAPDDVTAAAIASSRRTMLRHLAVGAAGAAAAGAGLVAAAGPAAAADGDNLQLGNTNNVATATTVLRNDSTGSPSLGVGFLAQNGTGIPNAPADGNYSALAGWVGSNGNSRNGVYGYSGRAEGAGVLAEANQYGLVARGGRAAARLLVTGSVAEVAGAPHQSGELIVTNEGDLWYVPQAGILRKVASAASAGQFHLLASPVRVYDSRSGTGTGFGPLTAASPSRAVSLQEGLVGTTKTPAVPAGATGAMVSLTVTNTTGSGFAALFSNAVTWPGTSSVNWTTAGQSVAVTTVSAVDATAQVKVQVGGGAGYGADIVLDVLGYYR